MTRTRKPHLDPHLEAELRRIEDNDPKVQAAKQRIQEIHADYVLSDYGQWRDEMVRDLYADTGDPQ